MERTKRMLSLLLCGALVASLWVQPVPAEGVCAHHPAHTEECGYVEASEGTPCGHEHTEDCYQEVTHCTHVHDESCYPAAVVQDPPAEGQDEGQAAPGEGNEEAQSTPENDQNPMENGENENENPREENREGNQNPPAEGEHQAAPQAREPVNCAHVCTRETGCVTRELQCQHTHDDTCGYAEGTPGSPCQFVFDICEAPQPECVCQTLCTPEAVNGACPVCGPEGADLTRCLGTAPVPAAAVTVESVQAMIDILPDREGLTEDNTDAVLAQLEAIDRAMEQLTPEEQSALDLTRYRALLEALTAPATQAVTEQFSLAPGGTYYFDLSGENIPGTVNDALPDKTLHYVPFTYVGTIEAYEDPQPQNPYVHSLFIANYGVTHSVSWDQLISSEMIHRNGTPNYTSGEVDYYLRVPSAGSTSDFSSGVYPKNNEWDKILDKDSGYIKNWKNVYSWGQELRIDDGGFAAVRGSGSSRECNFIHRGTENSDTMFRPVLGILDASTLGADGLKAVTLSLNGGSLGGSDTIQILVKSGSAFSAPAAQGLGRPSGNTDSYFKWLGSDGKLYEPGDEVPAEVTGLTALWAIPSYTVTLHPNGGTVAAGKEVTGYTYGQSVTLPGAGDMSRTGYTFGGWYPNDAFTGTAVSAIGSMEAGDKEYWAQWTVNQYTLTVRPENGQADITVTQDYGTAIPEPVLNREGYQFQGWDKPFPATMPAEDGTVTARWLDITAPTGSIQVASNSWKTLLDDISLGLFFKEAQTVTVTASDNSGEAVTVEYLLSDRALPAAQLPGMTFTPYSGPFAVNPDNEYVVYARLTDTAGNVAYLSSDGLVLDATSPGISGIENGRTYCGARLVTVTEKYLASVTVNGQPVTLDENSQFTLNPAKGTQTVTVTDKAGSKTSVTVTVNDGHTYEWKYRNGAYREKCKYCGEETGAVRYTGGTSPKTGDQSQVALGVALLCASAAGLVGIILYGRKLRKKDPME